MHREDVIAQLITTYLEMVEHTRPSCMGTAAHPCEEPMSCCDKSICLLNIEQAKWDWDVHLPQTKHKYPLMGPDGCTAPPHMRPICTMHSCHITHDGVSAHDQSWTDRYYELHSRIVTLEWEKRMGPTYDSP